MINNGHPGKEAKYYWTDFRTINILSMLHTKHNTIHLFWMAELGIHFVPLWNFPFHKILSLLHIFFHTLSLCLQLDLFLHWILFCLTLLSCYGFPYHRVRHFRLKWAISRSWNLLSIHNLTGDKTRIFISWWISWQYSRIFSLKKKKKNINTYQSKNKTNLHFVSLLEFW